MSERKAIPPKSQAFEHGGQRYTCTFDPNAPPNERWVWQVKYVRHYSIQWQRSHDGSSQQEGTLADPQHEQACDCCGGEQ